MHIAGRARGVAALTVVIGLILAGAAPGAASESPEVTCEFQPLAFLHTPLVLERFCSLPFLVLDKFAFVPPLDGL